MGTNIVDAATARCGASDRHVGVLLGQLEGLGVLNDTAVIISSDHGECLGELNAYGGHCFADGCTAHIPLIVRWPGVTDATAGRHDRGLHYGIEPVAFSPPGPRRMQYPV